MVLSGLGVRSVPPVSVRQHFVLVDLDNLLHALDGLQVRSLLVPLPLVPQFRRGDHFEQHARMFSAADHGIGNARRVALFVLRYSATADFRPTFRMAARRMKLTGQVAEDDAMFR